MKRNDVSRYAIYLWVWIAFSVGLSGCGGVGSSPGSSPDAGGGGGGGTTLAVSTSSLPSGIVNSSYNATLGATGGTQPYTWVITAGNLPAGLSLDSSTGSISGTPSASGDFSFTVEVTDSPGQKASASLSLRINPEGTSTLVISTTSLPNGTVNSSYSATLTATGGTQPYTWAITSGSLPAGLSLNSSTGSISGTPSASGSFSFGVEATDASAQTASQSLSIQVDSDPAPPPTAPPAAPGALSATPVTSSKVNLFWMDSSTDEDGFKIERCQNTALACDAFPSDYVQFVATAADVEAFTDTGLAAETTYSYRVGAFNIAGNSAYSNTAEAATPADSAPPGAINVSSCGTLDQANAYYLLQNDVASTGTCFTIAAAGIVLDLDASTVTYGSGGGISVHGVFVDGSASRVTNGTITQAVTAGENSHAIEINAADVEVDNLNITISSKKSRAVDSEFNPGLLVHHNNITSNVIEIDNRHQLEGYVIKLSRGEASGFFQVNDNTIVGGAQGGIIAQSKNARVFNNDIAHGGGPIGYSNNFCIAGVLEDSEIFNNYCHPIQGRGIHVDGARVKVYDNTIEVIGLSNNLEYGGCQLGGVYGIQIESGAQDVEAFNNLVTATVDECEGRAFRVTEVSVGSNRVYNNVLKAVRVGSSTKDAIGISTTEVNGTNTLTFENNIIEADTWNVEWWWGGSSNLQFSNNTFVKGSNPSSGYRTLEFGNGGGVSVGNILQDSIYQNGADDSVFNFWSGAQEADYTIGWTLTVIVKDAAGNSIQGATVDIKDSGSTSVFAGVTDAAGQVQPVLAEYKNSNTSGLQSFTPHTVAVSKSGFVTQSLSVTMDSTKSVTVTLSP